MRKSKSSASSQPPKSLVRVPAADIFDTPLSEEASARLARPAVPFVEDDVDISEADLRIAYRRGSARTSRPRGLSRQKTKSLSTAGARPATSSSVGAGRTSTTRPKRSPNSSRPACYGTSERIHKSSTDAHTSAERAAQYAANQWLSYLEPTPEIKFLMDVSHW